MTWKEKILRLKSSAENNVRTCIMPFWRDYMLDKDNGGFWGRVQEGLVPDPRSPKSVVLNCRLLWAYTRAYEMLKDERYKDLADRAFTYIRDHFYDRVYGGVYWMITCKGEPAQIEKRTYGQGFFIYSMAEYYKSFKNKQALEMALQTLDLLNKHVKCSNGGYLDSVTRDWLQDDWVNIWVKNRGGAAKLLNSNMHLFEAILNLAEATENAKVCESLQDQLTFLLDVAVDQELFHFKAGMDMDGNRIDNEINFGHDSECTYLMTRAADLLKDEQLIERARYIAVKIMDQVYDKGLDPVNGGMYYVADCISGEINRSKIWWVQAEGVTAFLNCFQLTGDERYLDAAISIWQYIENHMINHVLGEWYAVGTNLYTDMELQEQEKALEAVFNNKEMAGKGKCPYHNSRTCYEIIERANILLAGQTSI
jgi:mannobiose 2-epimerase